MANCLMPICHPMTVQIFVENVIKHALMPLSPIHLDILVEDSILYPGESFTVEIRDSGPGFKEDILQSFYTKNDVLLKVM